MCSMLPLPADMVEYIENIMCKRRSNFKMSSDIVLVINTSTTASSCEEEIVSWIRDRLPNTNERIHKIVSNTICDNWTDEERGGMIRNQLIVAIHLHVPQTPHNINSERMDEEQLVICQESSHCVELDASDVLNTLVYEPVCVVGIGVSAVSSDYMRKIWKSITKDRYARPKNSMLRRIKLRFSIRRRQLSEFSAWE